MIICQAHYFIYIFSLVFINFYTGQCNNEIANNIDLETLSHPTVNVTTNILAKIDNNITITCYVKPNASQIWWTLQDFNITDEEKYSIIYSPPDSKEYSQSILTILNAELTDTGNYTCNAISLQSVQPAIATSYVNVTIPGEVVAKKDTVRLKIDGHDTLYCVFKGLPLQNFHWIKENDTSSYEDLKPLTNSTRLNETHVNMTLNVAGINRSDNGTYHCIAEDAIRGTFSDSVTLLVLDKPQLQVDFLKAVGAHMIFINWTVNDGNDPILRYDVQFMENGVEAWQFYQEQIGGGNKSYVLKGFNNGTEYKFRVQAVNSLGASLPVITQSIRTLDSNPDFVPEISVNGVTFNSITIGWTQPPPELADHVQYYELVAQATNSTTNKQAVQTAQSMPLYLFINLEAATTYTFKVRACNEYTGQCGLYSQVVNGTTMDGAAGPPENVQVQCKFDNISQTSFLFVTFEPPKKPNGKIVHYNVQLNGVSEFKNERGVRDRKTYGPKIKTVDEKSRVARFEQVPPNTNYTVDISGTTRPKKHGEKISVNCTMPPTVPIKDTLLKFYWTKLEENGIFIFKLAIPKISEHTGPICCYRVFLVRLKPQQTLAELPPPDDMTISSYAEVHQNGSGGAYVAEMFTSDVQLTYVFLGDSLWLNSSNTDCVRCVGLQPAKNKPKPSTTTTTSTETPVETTSITSTSTLSSTESILEDATLNPKLSLRKRQIYNRIRRSTIDITKLIETNADKADPTLPYDGPLDENSNYTAFVEIIVHGAEPRQTMATYTAYMDLMRPASDFIPISALNDTSLEPLGLVTQIICGILLIAIIFIPAICILHKYTKQVARAQGAEMITLRNSFRQLCRSLRGRHQLVSSHPPNMAPIAKADLFDAYVERHRDSDYGFQQEFEQLPDRFPDRTTRASDARENIYKNRYPDIKAYDQTRVKLSQVDSIAGSDYINANVVLGYKERKKFICAQGPMDNTVCDYWRMIWEQRLELIMMLTNLEEYSKTKCAKYWPDKTEGTKSFGDINVNHINESRYSDYIIRELKVIRGTEERSVTQYHFLVWKDFMAPEHPHGILKFIKRMNEAHSLERGPVLVHCSAGVGRTGTLVALDSLLQQLQEEQQVTIFNTICDLRHQRNFLVQSLKQYIFVYRALMEMAQYGDTEMPANKLKTIVKNLKKCDKDNKSGMQEEYEKLKSVLEDRKAFSVGTGEENRPKNRSELVIPYDRNRVILTPIPGHEHSTYINASFIEGYDNSESFIITQDPLESTTPDFWRMIFEQGVNIIVMLSDLGSDNTKKCPRYWPDDEVTYDHIRVKYIQSESCPYYTRRELSVTNRKVDEVVMVTQLQYHGWPTVEGEVPEVTRGLIELADQVVQALEGNTVAFGSHTPPTVVHCCYGSDRSSMFVDICILIQQLRIEKRVDIFATTRKLRSQRSCMINTFAQYEFLYRAILNYADLHHLCEEVSDT
ncbi:tyrosine-protein phosphatase 69D [Chrysoperla carnea]|uniref:tyrosine-protein phosphatase 69D n=1 Tax=Chrysoperla carnea TaxID=189513 RepID=UPI001D0639D5|nr:tyrosine-protein phosphatase 69D [Chrysoperla carnea]